MKTTKSALLMTAVVAIAMASGCRKSDQPAAPATQQQAAVTEQQTQPMTGAPAPVPGGGCASGAVLMSDGTCSTASGAAPAPTAGVSAAPPTAMTPGAPAPAPAATTPAADASVASAPVAAAVPVTIPAGTRLAVRIGRTLTTQNAAAGQAFSGMLATAVTVRGTAVLQRGDRVSGTVVEARSPGKFKGEGVLAIRVNQVGGMPLRTSSYSQVVKGKGKRTAGFIGGGTGLGALLGGIAGGGKGAAIGAIAGAGAGTVGGAATGNKEVEIPAESVVTFRTIGTTRR